MKPFVVYLNPPSEIVPDTLLVLGTSTSDEILFSVHAVDARAADEITTVAFDQSVLSVDGKQLRLEGLATIQDSLDVGMLIVRSKFTVLES